MTIKAVVFDAYGTLYDIQSVASVTEQAFPGYGEVITQIWRMKQLEYTWLRSLMQRFEDFSVVTRESLRYSLDALGLAHDGATLDRITDKYLHLDPYPDAKATLAALKDYQRAILSNGSTAMLDALVTNSGFAPLLAATLSVDAAGVFKPEPEDLRPGRTEARRHAARRRVRVVEPVRRQRREGVRLPRGLDRAGDERCARRTRRETSRRSARSPCSRRRGSGPTRSASIRTGRSAPCQNCRRC